MFEAYQLPLVARNAKWSNAIAEVEEVAGGGNIKVDDLKWCCERHVGNLQNQRKTRDQSNMEK